MEYNGERESDMVMLDIDDIARRNMSILNIPITPESIQIVSSWETILFDGLCNGRNYISMSDLLDAYDKVMTNYGLAKLSKNELASMVKSIKLNNNFLFKYDNHLGDCMSHRNFLSSLSNYAVELKWRINSCMSNRIDYDKKECINWQRYGVLFSSITLEIWVFVAYFVYKIYSFDVLFSLMYSISALCSIGLTLLLLTFIETPFNYTIGAKMLPLQHINKYRLFFHCKFVIMYLLLLLVHLLKINSTLVECKNGCIAPLFIRDLRDDLLTISWNYFMMRWMYFMMFITIFVFIVYHPIRNMYYSPIVILIATICFISQQALDSFNDKFYILPALVVVWMIYTRFGIVWNHTYGLSHYLEFGNYIQITLKPRMRIRNKMLNYGCLRLFINHESLGKYTWHKCLMTYDERCDCSFITINKNKLCDTISFDYSKCLSVGDYSLSKFRFYPMYDVIVLFCRDSGIQEFLTMAYDKKMHKNTNFIKLIWQVNDIDVYKMFSDILVDVMDTISHLNIFIYYTPTYDVRNYIDNRTLIKFDYLQAIIFKHSGLDILSQQLTRTYCLTNHMYAYDILCDTLIMVNAFRPNADIGVFVCGNKAFVDSVSYNANILRDNQYGLTMDLWTEII